MSQKDKDDIKTMVETAKYLAQNDPQGLMLVKTSMDVLKARCDMGRTEEQEGGEEDASSKVEQATGQKRPDQ